MVKDICSMYAVYKNERENSNNNNNNIVNDDEETDFLIRGFGRI